MPRTARKQSSTGIYHVMMRGINRQSIFLDDEDNEKFLQTVSDCKKVSEFDLYAYCLMGNHVHLLIKEGKETLEQIFKRIGSRYVYWYNWKYMRCGHLFQDRYKSETVENDPYFVTVLIYIHQNPIKAGFSKTIDDYKWSSYSEYVKKSRIIDTEFALELIGHSEFKKIMNRKIDGICLENAEQRKRLTDDEFSKAIESSLNIKPNQIQFESREGMEHILRAALTIEGASTRQLSRVTGISANIIWRL